MTERKMGRETEGGMGRDAERGERVKEGLRETEMEAQRDRCA